MRILFVYPKYERHSESNPEIREIVSSESYLGTPSLSTAILAAHTPPEHSVRFVDDRIEAVPFDAEIDLVALPVFTPAATRAMEIADQFRARGVKVVAGGIFPTLMTKEMATHVDAVCIGEGEPVWQTILNDVARGELKPRYQADEPYDLTQQKIPRYDLYFDKEGPQGYITIDYPLQISRGCPLNCVACAIPPYMGKSIRFTRPEWVAENFRILTTNGKPRGVCLTEDISTLPTSRITTHLIQCLEASVGVGPRVAYIGSSPMQALKAKPEVFEFLRRLDAIQIYLVFGFDSVSRRAFQADRDAKMYQLAVDSVTRVFDEGLNAYCSLLVGHDEEDESVFDTILQFADDAKIKSTEFVILTPYPGTPLWQKLEGEGRIIDRTWKHYNDANVTFKPKNMTPEQLRRGYIKLWHEFYKSRGDTDWPIQV